MSPTVQAYQHGIYPRSEAVVAATRGLERGRTTQEEVDAEYERDRDDFVAAQRDAELDYFSDGLLRWQDIFRPLVEATDGLSARTLVRWFDNNSFFRAPEPDGDLSLKGLPAVYTDAVPEPRVGTLPSPFLFSRAAQTNGDRNALMVELAREVLAPTVRELTGRGYSVIHLQEPWLAFFGIDGGDWSDFEKSLTEVKDAAGDATLVLHTYFGDAGKHVDRLRKLPVDAVGIDFVDTDIEEIGRGWDTGILVGCLDGRSSPIESLDGTVDFVTRVAEATGTDRIFVSTNCEMEFLPRDVARQKVLRLGEVSRRLKETLA